MRSIVFTGGGTAGHVTPNIALFEDLKQTGWQLNYIGSVAGIERSLIAAEQVQYYPISSGKLRRYFDWKNFTDPFRVLKGYFQARRILRRIKPDIVFSKGGFVSVPVVMAAKSLRIPTVLHESDITPGLANKVAAPFADIILTTFPETVKHLPAGKARHVGTPIRRELLQGNPQRGLELCEFNAEKPVLMIMGGSKGAQVINRCVRDSLPQLLNTFQVVHLCGAGNVDAALIGQKGYKQFEYVRETLPDIFAAASCMVSRAGANALFEILSLQLPNLLIPLSRKASRGDQILNAYSFAKQGFSMVREEEQLTPEQLINDVLALYEARDKYQKAMREANMRNGLDQVLQVINEVAG